MYKRLQSICQSKGTNITSLCKEVTGNSGNLATWKKGHMRSDYLAKAADILECSTDYLLGRTHVPAMHQQNNSGNIVNGDNGNNSPLTVAKAEQSDEMQKEISSILSGLSFRERTELMTLIYKFADEHKK